MSAWQDSVRVSNTRPRVGDWHPPAYHPPHPDQGTYHETNPPHACGDVRPRAGRTRGRCPPSASQGPERLLPVQSAFLVERLGSAEGICAAADPGGRGAVAACRPRRRSTPSSTARSTASEYTVEKVYFESAPGFFVTGNLYRPKNVQGKVPGVMFAHGHWQDARLHLADRGQRSARRSPPAANASRAAAAARSSPCACSSPAWAASSGSGTCSATPIRSSCPARSCTASPNSGPEMNTTENWGLYSPQAEAHAQNIMGLQTLECDPRPRFPAQPARGRPAARRDHRRQRRRHADHAPGGDRRPHPALLPRRDGQHGDAGRLHLRERLAPAREHRQRRVRRPVRAEAAGHELRRRLDQGNGHQGLPRTADSSTRPTAPKTTSSSSAASTSRTTTTPSPAPPSTPSSTSTSNSASPRRSSSATSNRSPASNSPSGTTRTPHRRPPIRISNASCCNGSPTMPKSSSAPPLRPAKVSASRSAARVEVLIGRTLGQCGRGGVEPRETSRIAATMSRWPERCSTRRTARK